MKKIVGFALVLSVLLCALLGSCGKNGGKEKFSKYYFDYFDTVTTIIGYAESEEEFNRVCTLLESELESYHRLYNIYDSFDGLTNLKTINSAKNLENEPIAVPSQIVSLLEFCKEAHTLTGGKTNVAMGSVLSIWHKYRTNGLNNPGKAQLPSMDELRAAAEHTDIDKLRIFDGKVALLDSEMSLDVGAVAKGYAVEQLGKALYGMGAEGYLLNVGGNVKAIGTKPDGEGFSVGIENPDSGNKDEPHIAYLKLADMSLVTSGNYQRFYEVDGKRYHHIIDPQTLMPSEYFASVSVACKDSGLADALSTALFTTSLEDGRALVEGLDGVEALWVTNEGKKHYSSGFEALTFEYKE